MSKFEQSNVETPDNSEAHFIVEGAKVRENPKYKKPEEADGSNEEDDKKYKEIDRKMEELPDDFSPLEKFYVILSEGDDEDAQFAINDYQFGLIKSEDISEEGGLRKRAEELLQQELDSKDWEELRKSHGKIQSNLNGRLGGAIKKDLNENQSQSIEALRVRSQQYLEASLQKSPPKELQKFIKFISGHVDLHTKNFEKETDERKMYYHKEKLKDSVRIKDTILRIVQERGVDINTAKVEKQMEIFLEKNPDAKPEEIARVRKNWENTISVTVDEKQSGKVAHESYIRKIKEEMVGFVNENKELKAKLKTEKDPDARIGLMERIISSQEILDEYLERIDAHRKSIKE